ncbi:hypothetical protein AX769_21905 (plasmid) [Frondihabitans sp. PAMC 28766]|uniref:hypothetical protein n=1 Tax=Frondihabitans sp. PAMC 28766 TaxID=1795630 RepID=UPI00078B2C3B|nr:hypothetical protein [Frondihabitans sp. PAMC 28766]AMM22794.1 hypothetical protein AX769_21905 [Frondihabitans sp. PAMC 28766]
MTNNYDDLAARAEAGTLRIIPGTTRAGADAAAAGRAALLAATDTDTIEDATRIALGRPRVGETRTTTVVWKVRAPEQLDEQATDLAKHQGMNLSTLVRDAVAEYVRAHANA